MKRKDVFVKLFVITLLIGSTILMTGTVTKAASQTVKVKKIVAKERITFVRYGDKKQITCTVEPQKASNKEVTYWVDKKFGSVSKAGVYKPKKAAVGNTIKVVIKAKDGSKVRERVKIRVLPKINPKKKMVCLTFDDGVNASSTNSILNTLEDNNAVATFFVVGTTLGSKANKATLLRSYRMGNEIGNHTLNHKQLTKLSPSMIRKEIAETDRNIKRVIGHKATVVRPPYGSTNKTVAKYVGKPQILWSIDTLDWQHKNPSKTYSTVMKQVRNGSVVLMHDMYMQTAQAVKRIVPALKKKGYQFVTISEYYKYRGKKMKAGKVYNGR